MSKTQMIVLGSCVLAVAAILASAPAGEQTGPTAAPVPATRPYSRPRHRSMRLPSHKPLSQEEIDEIMAFMKEHAPAVHERLTTLLEENPRLAERLLRRMQWLYQRVRAYPPEVRAAAVKRHMLNPSIFRTLA